MKANYSPYFKLSYLMAATLLMSEMSCENRSANRLSQKESAEVILLLESIPPTLEIIEIDLDSSSHIELSSSSIKHSNTQNHAFYLGMIESRMSYSLYQNKLPVLKKLEAEAKNISTTLNLLAKDITTSEANTPTPLIHQNLLEYFESISHQLYEKEKYELQLLIVSGSWLETQNYLAEQYLINQDTELLSNILEQEITLDVILDVYQKMDRFQELDAFKKEFVNIKKSYSTYNSHINTDKGSQNNANSSIDHQTIVDKKITDQLMNTIIDARKNITL
jgi:hypothetical protein